MKASENPFPSVMLVEAAAPSAPTTGRVLLYAKSDGQLYSKDDAGDETALGGIAPVSSVNGQTGAVVLDAADVGAATTAQGATADSAVQPGDLAAVATSGAYADLSGKPTIPVLVTLTQAAYDALSPPDADTYYFIVG